MGHEKREHDFDGITSAMSLRYIETLSTISDY